MANLFGLSDADLVKALTVKPSETLLHDHLAHSSLPFNEYLDAHEVPAPATSTLKNSVVPAGTPAVIKPKLSAAAEAAHAELHGDIEAVAKGVKGTRPTAEVLTQKGTLVIDELNGVKRAVKTAEQAIGPEVNALHDKIKDLNVKGLLTTEQALEAQALVTKQSADVTNQIKSVDAAVGEQIKKVSSHTKVNLEAAPITPLASGAVNAAGHAVGEKGYIGQHAFDQLQGIQKETQIIKSNFQSGFAGKVKVGVGAIAVVDGLRRAYNGVSGMMSSDPEKQNQAGLGTLIVGGAEAAAGIAAMRWGGKAAATGMAI
jgi:hypothetical protein